MVLNIYLGWRGQFCYDGVGVRVVNSCIAGNHYLIRTKWWIANFSYTKIQKLNFYIFAVFMWKFIGIFPKNGQKILAKSRKMTSLFGKIPKNDLTFRQNPEIWKLSGICQNFKFSHEQGKWMVKVCCFSITFIICFLPFLRAHIMWL